MGKPLVRFCEGPGINEGQIIRGIRHVVVACDEAFHESLIEHLINDHSKTSVYSKVLGQKNLFIGFSITPSLQYSNVPSFHLF
ncbi:MAG TPA: hypothetical protein VN416_01340, partial [Desulfomonilia bacterium]|nr:hypothetical protein [Desulfomonilia bacterium]